MHPILNIAVRAARQAGGLIAQAYEQSEHLGMNRRPSREAVDAIKRSASRAMMEVIRKAYPQHTILSAEQGLLVGIDDKVRWLIEPLAEITNFTKRLPHFSVAAAVVIKERTEVAVLYDVLRNELFTAVRGAGTQMNGYRLRNNSSIKDLKGSVLAMGDFLGAQPRYPAKILQALLQQGAAFRCSGSAALDLAYVAAGRMDGFFEQDLSPWSFAVGELLVREAGGIVTDFSGSPDHAVNGDLVAGSTKVVKALLAVIRSVGERHTGIIAG